jgi:2-dehydropantoate 2-reductase
MHRLCQEAQLAANRAGIELDFASMWAANLENLERTGANRTSMLQDVEGGRRTEVDAICGQILQHARDEDELPCMRTIYSLVKALDARCGV